MSTQQEGFTKTDSDFFSSKSPEGSRRLVDQGTRCSGWLYRPKGAESPPIVIMAHGFAAEKTFRLPAYAERFVKEGMAAFVFDYRCFGDSDGMPRNLVNPYRHVQDWKAAIDHVRGLPNINHDRLALWGTSLSGGHVIVAAAHDPNITAIVSQVPFVDSLATLKNMGLVQTVRSLIPALRDVFRLLTLRSPYCVPVVGDPGTLACINTPGAKPGYFSMIPEGSSWKNECPARIFFTIALYRPTTVAKRVRCPALVIMAEKDSICPPQSVEKAASRMEKASLISMPMGHFDVYTGEGFEEAVEVETRFLREHLINAH